MSKQLSNDSPIYPIISKLRLIDMLVGPSDETVDYDGKHLIKRLRNYLIGNSFVIGSFYLYPADIKKILEKSTYKPKNSINESKG